MSIRFPVEDVKPRLRAAGGVRGMLLAKRDKIVSMDMVIPDSKTAGHQQERLRQADVSQELPHPGPRWIGHQDDVGHKADGQGRGG